MTRLDNLVDLLKKAPDDVFIQPHNVPDPDAIAASFGLRYLLGQKGITAEIIYVNEVEKANSLKMLELFGIDLFLASTVKSLDNRDWAVLVDCQKGTSNTTDLITEEVAVIDHHEDLGDKGYQFMDIRPAVGACSSLVADYFMENGITPPTHVSTALLYGILMDTDNLTRGVSDLDIEMFYRLYSTADVALINDLKGNQISKMDLMDYAQAFQNVEVYGEIGFLRLDNANDSLLGAASDIVLTIAGVNVVVSYSPRKNGIKFSTRSIAPVVKANELIRYVLEGVGFGGGHDSMAGGYLPADNLAADKSLDTFVRYRTISFMDKTE